MVSNVEFPFEYAIISIVIGYMYYFMNAEHVLFRNLN